MGWHYGLCAPPTRCTLYYPTASNEASKKPLRLLRAAPAARLCEVRDGDLVAGGSSPAQRRAAHGRLYASFARGVRWLALALGGVNVAVAVLAAWALASRQELSRRGQLLEVSQQIVAALREVEPPRIGQVFPELCAGFQDRLQGAQLRDGDVLLVSWGKAETPPLELPVPLGPRWRWSLTPRPGSGPLLLRLFPQPQLGASPVPPWLLPLVAAVVSGGLITFGLLMANGLAAQDRLAQLEKDKVRLETLALAGAGLAHRIRNPLAAIKGTAQVLATFPESEVQAKAARIVQASLRLETLVHELLQFTRPRPPQRREVNLRELAEQAAASVTAPVLVVGEAAPILADSEHILAILEELLSNARYADPGGELTLRITDSKDQVVVEVLDRGPGLTLSEAEAFQPYVSTKPEGTGLGLAFARALAAANNAYLRLANRPEGGSVAQLTLVRRGLA